VTVDREKGLGKDPYFEKQKNASVSLQGLDQQGRHQLFVETNPVMAKQQSRMALHASSHVVQQSRLDFTRKAICR